MSLRVLAGQCLLQDIAGSHLDGEVDISDQLCVAII